MSFPWLIPPKAERFFNNPDSFWSVMMVSLIFIPVKLQTIHLYKLGAAIMKDPFGTVNFFILSCSIVMIQKLYFWSIEI